MTTSFAIYADRIARRPGPPRPALRQHVPAGTPPPPAATAIPARLSLGRITATQPPPSLCEEVAASTPSVCGARADLSAPRPLSAEYDPALLAILDAPPGAGETIQLAFQRKERELLARFAQLSVIGATALHRRLSSAHPEDALAQRFSRLVVERRLRLLAFLADARRRAALALARR